MEKKILKKLVLNKEEIVNLNDFESSRIKGGSTWYCASKYFHQTVKLTILAYSAGEYNSWWNCEPINGTVITEVVVYGSDHCNP